MNTINGTHIDYQQNQSQGLSFAEKYGKIFENQNLIKDNYLADGSFGGAQSHQLGYQSMTQKSIIPNKPPLVPSRDLIGSKPQYQAYGSQNGHLNLAAARQPLVQLNSNQQSYSQPSSSASRIQNNRSSFGGMFELSNKIDRLGSGQRQQYPPPELSAQYFRNDYNKSNHSLRPLGGLASQNLILNKDNRIGTNSGAGLNQYNSPVSMNLNQSKSIPKLRQHQDSSQLQYQMMGQSSVNRDSGIISSQRLLRQHQDSGQIQQHMNQNANLQRSQGSQRNGSSGVGNLLDQNQNNYGKGPNDQNELSFGNKIRNAQQNRRLNRDQKKLNERTSNLRQVLQSEGLYQ